MRDRPIRSLPHRLSPTGGLLQQRATPVPAAAVLERTCARPAHPELAASSVAHRWAPTTARKTGARRGTAGAARAPRCFSACGLLV